MQVWAPRVSAIFEQTELTLSKRKAQRKAAADAAAANGSENVQPNACGRRRLFEDDRSAVSDAKKEAKAGDAKAILKAAMGQGETPPCPSSPAWAEGRRVSTMSAIHNPCEAASTVCPQMQIPELCCLFSHHCRFTARQLSSLSLHRISHAIFLTPPRNRPVSAQQPPSWTVPTPTEQVHTRSGNLGDHPPSASVALRCAVRPPRRCRPSSEARREGGRRRASRPASCPPISRGAGVGGGLRRWECRLGVAWRETRSRGSCACASKWRTPLVRSSHLAHPSVHATPGVHVVREREGERMRCLMKCPLQGLVRLMTFGVWHL